ncbi:MAG: hypothetical protein LBB04_00965, partial [Oscillospiraceae bacterium]|nr:hypothetical protein [Oscillospiraceae bacterium]
TQQGEKLVGELNCVKVATEGGPTTGTIVSICCGADGEAVLFTIEIQQGELLDIPAEETAQRIVR